MESEVLILVFGLGNRIAHALWKETGKETPSD